MGEFERYLTYLIRLELDDHEGKISVMSVVDALLDIRNKMEDSGLPFDGDEFAKARAGRRIC